MKKLLFILLSITFIYSCGTDDLLGDDDFDDGSIWVNVNSPAHDSNAPYRIGDSNSSTERIANCTGRSNTGPIITTTIYASGSDITLAVHIEDNIEGNSTHSISAPKEDFLDYADDLEKYLCERIKEDQWNSDVGRDLIIDWNW